VGWGEIRGGIKGFREKRQSRKKKIWEFPGIEGKQEGVYIVE